MGFFCYASIVKHTDVLHRCHELAAQGRRLVGNGAMVGAVLVREGKMIAEGFHEGFGKAHAERQLLENFEQKISSKDTLYINLEPCVPCATKRTPPCTDIILERGIKHVVIGMVDPDPRVSGKGIEMLRATGVRVDGPVMRAECERFNRGFVSSRVAHRPWITLKSAQTRDGRVMNEDGTRLIITSPEQDAWAHANLRHQSDAILVGVHTVVCDNPQLNIRLSNKKVDQLIPQPYRIILDPHVRVPMAANVVSDDHRQRTMLVVASNRDRHDKKEAELKDRGVRLIEVAIDGDTFDWDGLWSQLLTPVGDFHGLTSILVEGGPRTWERFKKAGMIDEEVVLIGR